MALVEIIGIASILPFMTLVGDMSLINQETYLSYLYQTSGVNLSLNSFFYWVLVS